MPRSVAKIFQLDGVAQRCVDCSETKPLECFVKASRTSTGRAGVCRVCSSVRYRERYRDRHLAHQRQRHTGVAPEQYEEAKRAQQNRCAICGLHRDQQTKDLAADHCHATGAFRGLLCNNCNQGLGKFRDEPNRLRDAALYLEGTLK